MTNTATLTENLPSSTSTIRVEKLTCSIGAELSGVDLGEVARDDALFAKIKGLLLEHKVLFFRDQNFSRAEHVELAQRFGELEDHPALGSDPDHPGLVRIYKDLDSPPEHFENAYHCDATWRVNPPMGCVLRCVETPPVGGDTIWVNMALAYENLSARVKDQIKDLRARHSIESTFGARMPIDQRHQLKERFPDAEHPVVRTHPETGEKILFVNSFATHLVNYHTPENVRYGIDYAPAPGICSPTWRARLRFPSTRFGGAGPRTASRSGTTVRHSTTRCRTTGLLFERWSAPESSATHRSDLFSAPKKIHSLDRSHAMHFHDDSLFPETQDKLVITVAPYGPEWEPDDFAEDLPLSMDEHVQQAVDCFNAGATVLHIHVRELDGKGSKRLSKFNELLGRLREAVPEMILQVGGSISFAPEGKAPMRSGCPTTCATCLRNWSRLPIR
ncbi:hypothetical protein GCM10020255_045180 [Rhodococcus baikonurensis]